MKFCTAHVIEIYAEACKLRRFDEEIYFRQINDVTQIWFRYYSVVGSTPASYSGDPSCKFWPVTIYPGFNFCKLSQLLRYQNSWYLKINDDCLCCGFLRYDTMSSGRCVLTFWRNTGTHGVVTQKITIGHETLLLWKSQVLQIATTVLPFFFTTLNKTAFLSNTTDPQVLEVLDKQRKANIQRKLQFTLV
jgi:hypothetical protein